MRFLRNKTHVLGILVSILLLVAAGTVVARVSDKGPDQWINNIWHFMQNVYFTEDVSISDDLAVTDDASVGGDLAVTGAATITGAGTVGGELTVTGELDVNGGLSMPILAITSSTTLVPATHAFKILTTTGATTAITLKLPTIATANLGYPYTIVKGHSNTLTVDVDTTADQIDNITDTAGDYIVCSTTTTGATVQLVAYATSLYTLLSKQVGTWTEQ